MNWLNNLKLFIQAVGEGYDAGKKFLAEQKAKAAVDRSQVTEGDMSEIDDLVNSKRS